MPSVLLQLAGSLPAPPPDGRRQVTITSKAGTTTLPITSPESDHGGIGSTFVEVPRPGSKPANRRTGPRLRTMRLEVTLIPGGAYPRNIDHLVLVLGSHSALGPCTVAYGRLEAGLWELTDVEIRTTKRAPITNDVVQATATLSFVEANPGVPRTSPIRTNSGTSSASPPAPSAAPPAAGPAPPTPRRHTVRSGETLFGIAQRYYQNGDLYPKIAKANGIRNANRIFPGQVLVIP